MATYTVIDAKTGEVVHVEELPAPPADPNAIDIAALKAKLAKATTTAGVKAVLGDVLDALDQQP